MDINFLIQDNKKIDLYLFVLDPLSVIIKLAILSNKSVGTKIYIESHVIYFQEPGPFQALCRYILKSNKTDIQYLYNPIEIACKQYLSQQFVEQYPTIVDLFKTAQRGLERLKETYRTNNIICLCFNYFSVLINNHLGDIVNENVFYPDIMTGLYTNELVKTMSSVWNDERIKIVLNLTSYLSTNGATMSDVKSLESIISGIDATMSDVT